jgi:hypothetical protein
MNAERNLALLRQIEANRWFLLMAYQDNPALLARAEPRIRDWFAPQRRSESTADVPQTGAARPEPDKTHLVGRVGADFASLGKQSVQAGSHEAGASRPEEDPHRSAARP